MVLIDKKDISRYQSPHGLFDKSSMISNSSLHHHFNKDIA